MRSTTPRGWAIFAQRGVTNGDQDIPHDVQGVDKEEIRRRSTPTLTRAVTLKSS
jgi:hypothetical protein